MDLISAFTIVMSVIILVAGCMIQRDINRLFEDEDSL
jgi:hypothetical protein